MKSLHVKSWKVLTLLSIVVPVGLLASFRLTGILPSPEEPIIIAETTTLDVTRWEFERMGDFYRLEDTLEGFYEGDNFSVTLDMLVWAYGEYGHYGGSDCLKLIVNVSASSTIGHVESLNLFFRDNLYNSRIHYYYTNPYIITENLSRVYFKDWAREVYINFTGVNNPGSVYFWGPIDWIMYSPANQSHEMDAFFEATYFNGTVYKRVVQPFQLRLIGNDDNDSFETADEIGFNSVRAYADDNFGDPEDYYKIWLEEGQVVQAELLLPNNQRMFRGPDDTVGYRYNTELQLYLYNPMHEMMNYSVKRYDAWVRQVTSTIDFTGWWYIKVESVYWVGRGVYVLNVTHLST